MMAQDLMILDSSMAVEAATRAETDIQIATAKRYPMHSDAAALASIQARCIGIATADSEIAAACCFALPRGGKTIAGPSVRAAEIISGQYGNLRIATRVVSIDDTMVTVATAIHDLESNVAYTVEVRRRITDSEGRRYNDDLIILTANAASSIAFRNGVFRMVPESLTRSVYHAALEKAVGPIAELPARRAKMVKAFALAGITERALLEKIGRRGVNEITREDLGILIGYYNAIRNGEIGSQDDFRRFKITKVNPADMPGAAPAEEAEPEPSPKTDLTGQTESDVWRQAREQGEAQARANVQKRVDSGELPL